MNSKDILNRNDEQNMGLDRSIEILAEMTRENTEKTLSYFDVKTKLEFTEKIDK